MNIVNSALTMRKNFLKIYIGAVFAILLGAVFFSSCARFGDDLEGSTSYVKEGERFTATVGVNNDLLNQQLLRAGGIEDIALVSNLRVLVFDENHNFLYSEDAELLNSTEDLTGVIDYLPDHDQAEVKKIRLFKVSLISSSKKRYVHFVANHDWTGFTQDYYAVGTSAGELLTTSSLVNTVEDLWGSDPKKLALWSIVEADQLNEDTFKQRVVKLLRNYSKVTVNTTKLDDVNTISEAFVMQSFAICNVYDRGTVAPFVTSGYAFEFPYDPPTSTTPVDVKIVNDEDAVKDDPASLTLINKNDPYFLFEKDNTKPYKRSYLIIKGTRTNTATGVNETRYYKVDLVKSMVGERVAAYFPIIRNKHYVVNINGVTSDGFKTIQEAIDSPAGNNVFADVKLQDFQKISDGTSTLLVDPIQLVVVKPGIYTINANYLVTNTDGYDHLKYYPSWDAIPDTINAESGYIFLNGNDPYFGALTKVKEGFTFEVKAIPEYGSKLYGIDVVALRVHDGTDVDGVAGATTPITRRVRITVNAPYLFHAELLPADANGIRNLTFRVYEEDMIPKTLFPFEVLIKASGLTPVNSGDKNVTVEYIKDPITGNVEMYYKYKVQLADQVNGKATIPFKVNNNTEGPGDITLKSQFYQDQTIYNSNVPRDANKLYMSYNKPMGYYISPRSVPTSSPFLLDFQGQSYSQAEFLSKFNINLESTGVDGYFDITAPEATKNKYLNESLTITSYQTIPSNYGAVRYTFTKTMTVGEWFSQVGTTTFDTTRVQIKGRVYYNYGYNNYSNVKPADTYEFYATSLSGYAVSIDLTSDFSIEYTPRRNDAGIPYFNFYLDSTNMKAFTDMGYLYLNYPNYSYGNDGKLFTNFESQQYLEIRCY
ncbi:hypothetical protein IX306_001481 [Porphyromonas levii]|uniref:hypothetical protein n=1 Tax=Porphyromonas levii TaxID=28114 RepID=UPI001BA9D6B4|nr:hypothetical protein [Porphyromonas levii]MBR8774354.1 hypothetical protein [Porphyromonas levii]